MGKNKGKGGKTRKKGKNADAEEIPREIIFKENELQEYAKITKSLGNCRFEIIDPNKIIRIGIIRGSMRKKIWIKTDDIVLISLRDFQNDKADIILKYSKSEVRFLQFQKEIPSDFAASTIIDSENDPDTILFDDDVEFDLDDIDNI